jgi:hypothetical protein
LVHAPPGELGGDNWKINPQPAEHPALPPPDEP